jgi:hypothetical protein
LWEEFYPRLHCESSPEDAAKIVVRYLRERVTIARLPGLPHNVPEIMSRQMTDETGFEIVQTAALCSVGVPSRLDGHRQTEFWNGEHRASAAQPVSIQSFNKSNAFERITKTLVK